MPKKQQNSLFETNSMQLFYMLCLYFLSVLVIYSVTQILNINNILGLIEVISLIIPITYILSKKKDSLILVIVFLLLTVLLPFMYNKTYDLTVDGNTYHKSAIAFIKNGWNPLYEPAKDFQKHNSNVVKIEDDSYLDLWFEHYPKATWIISAVIYNLTGNIESGKCLTLILSIMLLIITYNVLRKIIDKKWALLLSVLTTLNPIVLAQLFSYYLDGIMGICFLIELLLLFHINPMEKQNTSLWISLTTIATIFSNLKFTGLMCSGIIAAIFYFYWIFKYHKEKDFFTNFKKITYLFIGVYSVAIFLVGANTYVKNTIDYHNPLYPLVGKNKMDIVTTIQPKSFGKMNGLEKFVNSYFSRTENTTYEMNKPKPKYPFQVYRSEIQELYSADTRINGFGPLFTLSLIISIIIFIPSFIILYKKEKDKLKYVVITLLSIIISMILLKEAWWARYVPQFYFVVIGTIFLAIYIKKYINQKLLRNIFIIPLFIIILNTCMFLYVVGREYLSFRQITNDLNEMKNTTNLTISTNKELYGYQYVLKDLGIKYKFVDEIKEENRIYKYSLRIQVAKKGDE